MAAVTVRSMQAISDLHRGWLEASAVVDGIDAGACLLARPHLRAQRPVAEVRMESAQIDAAGDLAGEVGRDVDARLERHQMRDVLISRLAGIFVLPLSAQERDMGRINWMEFRELVPGGYGETPEAIDSSVERVGSRREDTHGRCPARGSAPPGRRRRAAVPSSPRTTPQPVP